MNIVVAYLYNQNGMGSWCIEASKAMTQNGHNVVLIKNNEIILPNNFIIPSIDFDFWPSTQNLAFINKVFLGLKKYIIILPFFKKNNVQLNELNKHIETHFFKPDIYLLNQSNLINTDVLIPQFVVAWAYKPTLSDYLRRAIIMGKINNTHFVELVRALTWHASDVYAYKNAASVLCVTEKLKTEISKITPNAFVVHPSYMQEINTVLEEVKHNHKEIKLCIMSLYLNDLRKGVYWMLKAISLLKNKHQFAITLIGYADNKFIDHLNSLGLKISFTGFLNREAAINILQQQHVLLFGSVIDDWGFVQVEAMANGLMVIAPNEHPCDEIVLREDFLYKKNDPIDFSQKIEKLQYLNFPEISKWFIDHYQKKFSPEAFAKSIDFVQKNCIKRF